MYSKESLVPGRLWEATLNWGKGFSFRKGVVLEIVLLRRKVDMMGKTFSSSLVRDCSNKFLISEFFFRIGQILFNLARAFKAHHKESFCFLSFFKVSFDHHLFDNLVSGKRNHYFGKKSLEEVLNFGFKNLYEPWSGAITK